MHRYFRMHRVPCCPLLDPPTPLIPPKHNNWPPICDATAPMTAFGQHSMVPPFYANRASMHRALGTLFGECLPCALLLL